MTESHGPDLHTALHDLTDGPPPDLADLVLSGADRRRNRTRMLTVVATVATLAVVALPIATLRHRAPPGTGPGRPGVTATLPVPTLGPPATPTGYAHPPAPGGGPRVLDAFVISPGPDTGVSELLDRSTGRYVELPYSGIELSPDGSMVAVLSRGNGYTDPHVQVGVVSRTDALAGHTDRVRWLAEGATPTWSPDGSRLLVETTQRNRVLPSPLPSNTMVTRQFAVFTTGSWQRADIELKLNALGYYIGVGWSPDSSQLIYPLVKPESTPEHTVMGAMQYLHLDGTPGQRVGDHGDAIIGTDAYSPSRQRVTLIGSEGIRVVDTRSWHSLVHRDYVDNQFAGWYDDDHVIMIKQTANTGDQPVLQVVDMSGHVTKQVPMPGNSNMSMQFRSSTGLTGAAANLGF